MTINLQPVIDKFKEGLSIIEQKTLDIKSEAEKELNKAVQHNKDLKAQKDEGNKLVKAKLFELDESIKKEKVLQVQLQEEIKKTVTLNKSVELKAGKVIQSLLNAEAERNLALEERKKAEKIKEDWQKKIDLLKTDFELLRKRSYDLNEHMNRNKAKDKELLKREEKVIESESNISIREIELKKKWKQVELEMKRSNV